MKLLSLFLAILILSVNTVQAYDETGQMSGVNQQYPYIKCIDQSSDSAGSAYTDHTYSLQGGTDDITSYNWQLLLKYKDSDKSVQVQTGTDETFTIHKIDSPENYIINGNGQLVGTIRCDYIHNGGSHSITWLDVSLDLKPIILSIDNFKKIESDTYAFYLIFDVRYEGADYVYVEIEEEYDSSLRNYRFDEPNLAHVKTGNISCLYHSIVTVFVTNKYGTASESLKFSPSKGLPSETLVHDISYDYQLFEQYEKLNCAGILRFSLSVPENVSHIVLGRSHRLNPYGHSTSGKVFIAIKEDIPLSATEVEKSDIYWNTHFQVTAFLNDGSYILSPLYTISDFIDAKDLELLNGQAGVEDIDVDDVKLYSENYTLHVETDKNLVLSVFDISGRCLYNGNISSCCSIPLNNTASPFLIVRYSDSISTTTKKIIIR